MKGIWVVLVRKKTIFPFVKQKYQKYVKLLFSLLKAVYKREISEQKNKERSN